jgi:hypothetical protein
VQSTADVPGGGAVDAGLGEGLTDRDFFCVLAGLDDAGRELPGDASWLDYSLTALDQNTAHATSAAQTPAA